MVSLIPVAHRIATAKIKTREMLINIVNEADNVTRMVSIHYDLPDYVATKEDILRLKPELELAGYTVTMDKPNIAVITWEN